MRTDLSIRENDRVEAVEGKHAFKLGTVVSLDSFDDSRVQVRFDGDAAVHHVVACQLCLVEGER